MKQKLECHILACRLNAEVNELVVVKTRYMVQPRNILSSLKFRREYDLIVVKLVYNSCQMYKKIIKALSVEMTTTICLHV
jgi:phage anti-repressor protein